MGFGSYDESEQREQDYSDDDEDAVVSVHGSDYEGTMSVDTSGSTDDLIGRLQDIKDAKNDE